MASVASTFTAVGNSSNLFVIRGRGVRVSLTGTWVATVQLQRSNNGGQSWEVVRSYTANVSEIINPAGAEFVYRLQCFAFTSGTVTYQIDDQSAVRARSKFTTVPIGSVAYSSFGTSTTPVAGTLYLAEVIVEADMNVTGIGALIGAVGGTDKFIYSLYDNGGNLVANTAVAGVTVGTANTIQEIALDNSVRIPAGQYFIGVTLNGTTARLRTVAASTFVDVMTKSQTGTFGTIPANINVPVTFTADVGPVAYLY